MTAEALLICHHCLLPVSGRDAVYEETRAHGKAFCCRACRAVYLMILEEGLQDFYRKREWKSGGIPRSLRTHRDAGFEPSEVELEALRPFIYGEGRVKEADLMIEGIRCPSCVWLNEKVLERTDGVLSARINFATHRGVVTWDSGKTTLGRVVSRMRSIGYLARPYTPAAQEETLKKQDRDLLVRLGTAFFFSMQLMTISVGLYAGYFQGIDPAAKRALEFASLALCAPVVFYSGWPFLRGAYQGLLNRTLNMDVLISLGSLSAYALSVHHLITGGEVYFDTSAMIIAFVLLGRFLEHSAKRKASQAVTRLLTLQPREARAVRGNERIVLDTTEITKGDLLEVRPGEMIPLDGLVREGLSDVDEALVTGESHPVEKGPGAEVIGGSLNGLGAIIMEVTRIGQETLLARIARLVEHAQAAAAPVQRFADRVSLYFIPFVLTAAVGTLLFWSRQSGNVSPVLAAVSVLVIACPCALGLAAPLAVLAGTGRAARNGILIKGGDIFERLYRADTIVLDKTGTITTGKMTVADFYTDGRYSAETVLRYAASAEQHSEHRAGKAIVDFAKGKGIGLVKAEAFRAEPGRGVVATIGGSVVLVGKSSYLMTERVALNHELISQAEQWEQGGRTVVWVSRGKELLGIIALRDAPKPDARKAVDRLKRMKLDVMMITGDNVSAARAIAAETGITTIRAGVPPDNKSEEISRLRSAGNVVVMVGDGINDAPALASADVGMAMATGSDIAMESADVVLMRSDLAAVVEALEVSRTTFTVIKQNLFWAFFYNAAAIPLAMAGALHPIISAAAMAMSSLTVVTNSLRLRGPGRVPKQKGRIRIE